MDHLGYQISSDVGVDRYPPAYTRYVELVMYHLTHDFLLLLK